MLWDRIFILSVNSSDYKKALHLWKFTHGWFQFCPSYQHNTHGLPSPHESSSESDPKPFFLLGTPLDSLSVCLIRRSSQTLLSCRWITVTAGSKAETSPRRTLLS